MATLLMTGFPGFLGSALLPRLLARRTRDLAVCLVPGYVARRPDLLVIESGEIELPGEVTMKHIGLQPGVVYACMAAETVVLAPRGPGMTCGQHVPLQGPRALTKSGVTA